MTTLIIPTGRVRLRTISSHHPFARPGFESSDLLSFSNRACDDRGQPRRPLVLPRADWRAIRVRSTWHPGVDPAQRSRRSFPSTKHCSSWVLGSPHEPWRGSAPRSIDRTEQEEIGDVIQALDETEIEADQNGEPKTD